MNDPAVLDTSTPHRRGGLAFERLSVAEDSNDPRSPRAVRQVLQRYFALVDSGPYDDAASFGLSIAAQGRVGSAAGSMYVEMSLQLLGHCFRHRFPASRKNEPTLVNGLDGASIA